MFFCFAVSISENQNKDVKLKTFCKHLFGDDYNK